MGETTTNNNNSIVTLGQQYSVGEKTTVILYTYINRHAEPLNIKKTEDTVVYSQEGSNNIDYDNSVVEPYKNRGLGQQ